MDFVGLRLSGLERNLFWSQVSATTADIYISLHRHQQPLSYLSQAPRSAVNPHFLACPSQFPYIKALFPEASNQSNSHQWAIPVQTWADFLPPYAAACLVHTAKVRRSVNLGNFEMRRLLSLPWSRTDGDTPRWDSGQKGSRDQGTKGDE